MKRFFIPALTLVASTLTGAQSLTTFGVMDLALRQVKAGDVSTTMLATDGLAPSRIGFRGTEDLGNGYSSSFWLESGIAADVGSQVSQKLWFRRSTVSLAGPQGEVRLGRDYTPAFMGYALLDPFTAAGVGAIINVLAGPGGTLGSGATTAARADNAIGYVLPPNLGGLHGQLMVAPGEGTAGTRHRGLRLGYANGPLDLSAAVGSTNVGNGGKYKISTVGGAYQMGAAKAMLVHIRTQWSPLEESITMLGGTYKVGTGTVRLSHTVKSASGGSMEGNDVTQTAVGYVHDLSRRTALYGTYARIKNSRSATQVPMQGFTPAPGRSASGLELGLRHVF